jgi:hypothetical protein
VPSSIGAAQAEHHRRLQLGLDAGPQTRGLGHVVARIVGLDVDAHIELLADFLVPPVDDRQTPTLHVVHDVGVGAGEIRHGGNVDRRLRRDLSAEREAGGQEQSA